jgi:hypothetical protein
MLRSGDIGWQEIKTDLVALISLESQSNQVLSPVSPL